ncbi:hypothetical protein F4810DRAFT_706759 [Camillea tinctor]|nr:hypothetical protein F4810DRAFT_706759 [Camillea tinctor]
MVRRRSVLCLLEHFFLTTHAPKSNTKRDVTHHPRAGDVWLVPEPRNGEGRGDGDGEVTGESSRLGVSLSGSAGALPLNSDIQPTAPEIFP